MKKKKREMKKGQLIIRMILLFVLMVGIGFGFIPLFKSINYGLDLQGGFEVLYEVSTLDGSKMTKEKLTNTYKTILKRTDVLGVNEPDIVTEGNNKIRVKLAGVKNQDEARNTISTTASLTFRDTNNNLLMTSAVLKSGGAKLTVDNSGNPAVLLSIKDTSKFYEVTNKIKDYNENRIVIWLDFDEMTDSYATEKAKCGSLSSSKCLSAASVTQAFSSDVIIQGNFTREEATSLVDLINSGSLPTKLTEISSKTVGASFGEATLQNTLIAGIIGISLIIVLMIGVYRFSGVISGISMIIYSFLVFLVFYIIGGVLTLPGIAAIVLGIGMAVDSNVITFERIKDELYHGKSLVNAFRDGSKSSFGTILDSNLTTLLVAVVLFVFGESSVKGFATMLIITIAVTMLIMVFLTRTLMKSFVNSNYFSNKLNLFIGISSKKVVEGKNENRSEHVFAHLDFVKYKKIFFIIPLIIIVGGIVMFGIKGLNLGIDYQGGSDITIDTKQKVEEKQLHKDIESLKLKARNIEITSNGASIQVNDVLDAEKVKTVNAYFEEKYEALVDIGVVSNLVKKDLTKNAFISVIIAIICMIIYISIRFKFTFAISSVIALAHDVIIIIAIFALCHLEVSVMFIAAILAIIGYSINDTIVIFDRVRGHLIEKKSKKQMTKEELETLVNVSLRESLTRTILTTITTLLPVISLIFLGSREILNFNLAMLIGLIAGTYSSILIALEVWYLLEKKHLGKNDSPKKKWLEGLEDEDKELKVKGINS